MKKLIFLLLLLVSLNSYSQALVGDVAVIGNSTVASYLAQNAVSSYLSYTGTLTDIAVPGNTINQQLTIWNNLSAGTKSALEWVFIEIGLNDVGYTESTATVMTRYQNLVNAVDAAAPNAKIIVCTMTPCKQRWIDLFGATNGATAQAQWAAMNEAIKGNGSSAITKATLVAYSHTASLADANGNLAAAYDMGDHIHPNNAGRSIIGTAWMAAANGLAVADYYVAPYGNDSHAGTAAAPFLTWQKAFSVATAGDVVYFRGGLYKPTRKYNNQTTAIWMIDPNRGAGYGTSGTHDQPICYYNYPGEVPIMDGSLLLDSLQSAYGLSIMNVTNLKFRGLTIQNVPQFEYSDGGNSGGWSGAYTGTIYLDKCRSFNNGGAGFHFREYDSVYVTNCDAALNCDSLIDRAEGATYPKYGGSGDGFIFSARGGISGLDSTHYTYFHGNRSWKNSDDGFDLGSTKELYIDSCWAWDNGKLEGDGTGYKISYGYVQDNNKRIVKNNISAYNKSTNGNDGGGYYEVNLYNVDYGPRAKFFNNSSYRDRIGFADAFSLDSADNARVEFRNNITYDQDYPYQAMFSGNMWLYPDYVVQSNNTWTFIEGSQFQADNPVYTVSSADFQSLDTAQLANNRQSDGTLPVVNFMHLAPGSDLIDTGIDVGLPYNDSAPDLGWAESGDMEFVPVTSLTVSGYNGVTSISTDNGTLQMEVAVAPGNATVQTVSWSIINVSGSATVTQNGLVMAVTNGTVIVRATAQDGSDVTDDQTLTITGQESAPAPSGSGSFMRTVNHWAKTINNHRVK